MPKAKTLHELLTAKLNALLYVGRELVDALPDMVENATDEDLKEALQKHLEETKGHVEKVEQSLDEIGENKDPLEVEAIKGLIDDAKWIFKNVQSGPVLDAAIIAAGQCVEHHEIASYGTAKEWASLMQHDQVVNLLDEILEQEKGTDETLNNLAIDKINESVETGM